MNLAALSDSLKDLNPPVCSYSRIENLFPWLQFLKLANGVFIMDDEILIQMHAGRIEFANFPDSFFELMKSDRKLNHRYDFTIVFVAVRFRGHLLQHSNVILFDYKNKTIERFEPHGKYPNYGDKYFDDFIQIQIDENENSLGGWIYKNSQHHGPIIGVQQHQASDSKIAGFCVTYCFLFVHLRCLNRDKSYEQIVRAMCYLSPIETLDLIKRYAALIEITCEYWIQSQVRNVFGKCVQFADKKLFLLDRFIAYSWRQRSHRNSRTTPIKYK